MIDRLLSVIAPHYCVACRREGCLLCLECQQLLLDSAEPCCIMCGAPRHEQWLCTSCRESSQIDEAWLAGSYDDALKKLIFAYKFERAKSGYRHISALLEDVVPYIFTTTIVVSIPTLRAHIRQRGYDHTALFAKEFAKNRHFTYSAILKRKNNKYRQVGANRVARLKQAEDMFEINKPLPVGATILLVDDVVTTGATVAAAAKTLKNAGAKQVFVAACTYEKRRQ